MLISQKRSDSIGVDHIYKKALVDLEKVKETFKKMPLPQSRGEFENRAVLYQFFNDIEEFFRNKRGIFKKIYFRRKEKSSEKIKR